MTEERPVRKLLRPVSAEIGNDPSSATPLLGPGSSEPPQLEEVHLRTDTSTDPSSRRRSVSTKVAETPQPEEPRSEIVHSKTDTSIDSSSRRPPNSAKIFTAWQNLANKYWIYELSSSLISVLALAGLFAMLGSFNGHARPNWPAYASMNTIVAITTAILKASMMLSITEGISELKWQWFTKSQPLIDVNAFDSASRGPWGSFLFLFNFKRHLLATFGAVITIFALAIDPFSQQVLHYRNCLEPNDLVTAQISVTNYYTLTGGHTGPLEAAMRNDMTLAIYNGLLSSVEDGLSLVSFTCPSGNCTFASDNGATYSSLAICYKTQDITQHIQTDTRADGIRNYSLPSGPRIGMGLLLSSVVIVDRLNPFDYGEDDRTDMMFTFDALMANQRGAPFAVRSSIYPCVKTWGANITLNEFRETEITSVLMELNYGRDHTYVTNDTLRNGTWQACNPTSHVTDTNTVSVSNTRPGVLAGTEFFANNIENGTTLWYPFDCTWRLGGPNGRAISSFLHSLFHKNNVTLNVMVPGGDIWLQNLYKNGTANISTVNDYMKRLTSSMTASVRSHGDPAPAPYTNYASGAVLENQTCIHVNWAWLALPASLVLCSIMFLVATITLSAAKRRTDPANAWIATAGPLKSSPLPLLFHGVEPSALLATGHPSNLNDMQRLAESLDVRLGHSSVDGNWYFLRDENQRRLVKSSKRDV